jgi:hypothetical protein
MLHSGLFITCQGMTPPGLAAQMLRTRLLQRWPLRLLKFIGPISVIGQTL